MVARERGFTMMDVVVGLAVLSLVATAMVVGEQGQLRQVGHSFDELELSRAAASRLERMEASEPGEREFAVDVEGAVGHEVVRIVEPGLCEVTVTVRRGTREFRLVTLREAR